MSKMSSNFQKGRLLPCQEGAVSSLRVAVDLRIKLCKWWRAAKYGCLAS